MTDRIDAITEADLHAYVDDQLTSMRRILVEAYLSQHPKLAARVMADLRGRDELRLAMSESSPVIKLASYDAARRLERAMRRDIYFAKARRFAAVIALVAFGWFAHIEFVSMGSWNGAAASAMPAYVDEAARAHRTAILRASMHSQTVQPHFDREEIRAATSIVMPSLPQEWEVLDVQIFPSSGGPSVEVSVQAGELGRLSLFAVQLRRFAVMPATVTSSDEMTAAYWQIGDTAYALVGAANGKALNEAAINLAATLY